MNQEFSLTVFNIVRLGICFSGNSKDPEEQYQAYICGCNRHTHKGTALLSDSFATWEFNENLNKQPILQCQRKQYSFHVSVPLLRSSSSWGLVEAETHPLSNSNGNLFSSFCVTRFTIQHNTGEHRTCVPVSLNSFYCHLEKKIW